MLQLLVLLVGAGVGFVGSRAVRRSTGGRGRLRAQAPEHAPEGRGAPAGPAPTRSAAPTPAGAPRRPTVATVGPSPAPSAPSAHRPAPTDAVASLARTDGGHHDHLSLTAQVVTVGRAPDQDLTVPEVRVSRHHGTFRRAGGGWTYTDDGSSNGSRINGGPVPANRPVALRHGDRIEVGRATFTFRQLPPS